MNKMKRQLLAVKLLIVIFILIFVTIFILININQNADTPTHSIEIKKMPEIDPDYSNIIIPANIAPMNFYINEPGSQYLVKIVASNGMAIKISSKNGKVIIPERKWKKLLAANQGEKLNYYIYIKQKNQWYQYRSFSNIIAKDSIDSHLVYRLIEPSFIKSKMMGLYQRNLTNFQEKTIIAKMGVNECYNCHSFHNKKADNWMFHIRGEKFGATYIIQNDMIKKIDTRTAFNKQPGAYRSWHPSGKLIAFSANIVRQFLHAAGYPQEGYDTRSDLILYKIDANIVTTNPAIASPLFMETYPEWSPDGRYLYYCRAPQPSTDLLFEEVYDKIMYDLYRIAYDLNTDKWGQPEIVLSSENTGLSVTQPRISPDGRYLACAMTKWGTFGIHRPGGDIYLLNLESGDFYKPDINSEHPESYNSWSSNSRWLAFSSKRRDGVCTRVYFSYIDRNGYAYKPFIMPQEDPTFYDTFIFTYNVPEFVDGPIKVSGQKLIKAAFKKGDLVKAIFDPKINLDGLTGATVKKEKEEQYMFQ
jgi:hypothetical protein